MALFENFPYTNLHELNLDWLINEIKKIEDSQVISVNGQTGEVILYQDAQILLPSVTDDHWSVGRMTDGTYRGIMFGNDDKAYIVHGNLMAQLYSSSNPPTYPVTRVNGQTGDVVLYSEAEVRFPNLTDAQLHNWNMWRYLNNTMSGIEFDDTGKAYLIVGTNRYQIYTSNDQPNYPVTSVNNQTGAVTLNIPEAFVDNPAASELTIAEDIPDASVWALLRETENGYVGIAVNNGVNPAAYLQIGTGATAQQIKLLTMDDIPTSSGVISINTLTGVVTLTGAEINLSNADNRKINTIITALENKTGTDILINSSQGALSIEQTITNNKTESDTTDSKIMNCVAYNEEGNTATHNIPKNNFVIWKGKPYKSTSAISIGTTLSTSNLTAIPNEGITNNIFNFVESSEETLLLTANGHIKSYKSANVISLVFWWAGQSEISSLVLPSNLRPKATLYLFCFRLIGSTYTPSIMDIETNGQIYILNQSGQQVTDYNNIFACVTYVE